jgi:UTP--glucose-1-phosphate uridylyltransferase
MEQFIKEGREYVFISNIDNLGSTVDLSILNFLLDERGDGLSPEFLMEVTDKTRADIKVCRVLKSASLMFRVAR